MVRSGGARETRRLRRSVDRLTRATNTGTRAERDSTRTLDVVQSLISKALTVMGLAAPADIAAERGEAASLGLAAAEFINASRRLRELGVQDPSELIAIATRMFPGASIVDALEEVRDMVGDPLQARMMGVGELLATGGASLAPTTRMTPDEVHNLTAIAGTAAQGEVRARRVSEIVAGKAPRVTTVTDMDKITGL